MIGFDTPTHSRSGSLDPNASPSPTPPPSSHSHRRFAQPPLPVREQLGRLQGVQWPTTAVPRGKGARSAAAWFAQGGRGVVRFCRSSTARILLVVLLLVLVCVHVAQTPWSPEGDSGDTPTVLEQAYGQAQRAAPATNRTILRATTAHAHDVHARRAHTSDAAAAVAAATAAPGVATDVVPSAAAEESAPAVDPSTYLYVISPVFNPSSAPVHVRHALYRNFSARMHASPHVRLVTVEAVFAPLGQAVFAVTEAGQYPMHLQVRAHSVAWIKESLINYAVRRLPSDAKWIAWIDADVLFDSINWAALTLQALQRQQQRAHAPLVQLFEHVRFLDEFGGVARSFWSFGYSVQHRLPLSHRAWGWHFPHTGFGWATTRDFFLALGGLPETHIIGGADMYLAMATQGRADEWIHKVNTRGRSGLHAGYVRCSQQWEQHVVQVLHGPKVAQQWMEAKEASTGMTLSPATSSSPPLSLRGRGITASSTWSADLEEYLGGISYVPVNVSHVYHRSEKSRYYTSREVLLMMHEYDPMRDLQHGDNEGEEMEGGGGGGGGAQGNGYEQQQPYQFACVPRAEDVGRSLVRLRTDATDADVASVLPRSAAAAVHADDDAGAAALSLLGPQQPEVVKARMEQVTRRRQLQLALLTYFRARDVPERATAAPPATKTLATKGEQDVFAEAAAAAAAASALLPAPVLLPGETMELLSDDAMQVVLPPAASSPSSESASASARAFVPSASYSDFWVIAVVFNPANFSVRYDLYDAFAARVAASGASLLTVECIFPVLGQHTFRITQPNNPNHIQVESPSVMWIKEESEKHTHTHNT